MKAPTRPISGKVLDLLLATYPNAIGDPSNVCGLSDHLAVIFEVNFEGYLGQLSLPIRCIYTTKLTLMV